MATLKLAEGPGPAGIRFSLGDINRDMAAALAKAFADLPYVEVVHGDLLDLSADAVVCPGNSFGDMGGGFDKAVDDFHGGKAQPAVIEAIRRECFGELAVGASLVVEVPGAKCAKFLVVAPTMRIPGLSADGVGAYLATRAALVAVLRHEENHPHPIGSIAIPGMCTGIGGMSYTEAASQMRTAFANVLQEQWRRVLHPAMAPYALRK